MRGRGTQTAASRSLAVPGEWGVGGWVDGGVGFFRTVTYPTVPHRSPQPPTSPPHLRGNGQPWKQYDPLAAPPSLPRPKPCHVYPTPQYPKLAHPACPCSSPRPPSTAQQRAAQDTYDPLAAPPSLPYRKPYPTNPCPPLSHPHNPFTCAATGSPENSMTLWLPQAPPLIQSAGLGAPQSTSCS